MTGKKWAIIGASRDGVTMGLQAQSYLEDVETVVYTLPKYCCDGVEPIEESFESFFGKCMKAYDMLLCIMATGIVVRSIAPHLVHKAKDPGVLVMDAKGEYIISLLSGHLGGANGAAVMLGKRMGATPIITTGTDIKGSMAVDVLGEKLGCTIANFTGAKNITAKILDGDQVVINNQSALDFTGIVLPTNVTILPKENEMPDQTPYILISDKNLDINPNEGVQLVPKTLIVGIGCRQGKEGEAIISRLKDLVLEKDYSPLAIKTLATIPLKAEEPGILSACEAFKATLKIVEPSFVKMVQGKFEGSDFVEKTTGLRAVSEPCGYVASGFGKCVASVVKENGMTLSLWQKNEN